MTAQLKKNICFCLSDDVSISSARKKRSDGFDIWDWTTGLVETVVAPLVESESTENLAIVGKLVGKLIENTAFSAQSYNSSFKLRRVPIYGLIYTVQNEQIMLDEQGVEPIQMKRSEFLDTKHIRLVFFVCHKTSDVISDVDSYLTYFFLFVFEGQNNFMFQIPIDQIVLFF